MRILALLMITAGMMVAQAAHSVTLTWAWSQGTGGTATGFSVKRATVTGGPYTTIGSTTVSTLTYVDTTGLVEGTKYFYVVTATGPGGESAPSGEASGTIPFSVPVAPATPTVTAK